MRLKMYDSTSRNLKCQKLKHVNKWSDSSIRAARHLSPGYQAGEREAQFADR